MLDAFPQDMTCNIVADAVVHYAMQDIDTLFVVT